MAIIGTAGQLNMVSCFNYAKFTRPKSENLSFKFGLTVFNLFSYTLYFSSLNLKAYAHRLSGLSVDMLDS